MAAGIFGYMGYNTVRLIEALPDGQADDLGLPDSILVRPTLIVVFDSVKDELCVVTPVRPAPGVSAKAAYARAGERLNVIIDRLDRPLPHKPDIAEDVPQPAPRSMTSPDAYKAKVAQAKEYIAAGDVSRSCSASASRPLSSFRHSRCIEHSGGSTRPPFLYYLNFGDFAVVGSSPEILVRVRKGDVTIRPIAGTRPRAKRRRRIRPWPKTSSPTPRNAPSILMLLESWAQRCRPALRKLEVSRSQRASSWNTTAK